jgi:glycerol uptake facilitator-like aquaporin
MMKSYIAEFVGTALLLAIVAGSGIMGETLSQEMLPLHY